MNPKALSLLGIAAKAGKVQSGNFQVEEAVKSGTARMVLVSEDSSERSKKSYSDMCKYYHTELYIDGTTDEISRAIGKMERKALCITDKGLSDKIIALLAADRVAEETNGKNS